MSFASSNPSDQDSTLRFTDPLPTAGAPVELSPEQRAREAELLQRRESAERRRQEQEEQLRRIKEASGDTSRSSSTPPEEKKEAEITFWTIVAEMWLVISSIPKFALSGLKAAFNPYNIASIYSGWVGKYAALAAFSYAVSNLMPTFVRAGLAFIVRAAFPQLSIAADLLQFMTSPGFIFASLAAASQLFDKGVAGEAGKIYGKDPAKDFVKTLVKFPKEPATGRTWADWRQYIFSKTVEIAGLIGGTFGTAYGVFLAQAATMGGTSFIAALPVVGPIAAVGAGVVAVVNNIGILALGSFAAGVVMFGSKEIYDVVGGFGSSFGQQRFAEAYAAGAYVADKAYLAGAHVANRTGIDTRYEAAKAAVSTRYEGAKTTASTGYESVKAGVSTRYEGAKAMMFRRNEATPAATQPDATASAELGNAAAQNDSAPNDSCFRSVMRTICRV